MKKSLTSIVLLLIITHIIGAQTLPSVPKTLFERLGGTSGITAIVDDVFEAHMINPARSARFKPYRDQPERLPKIRQHTIDFFSAGSGGPANYKGRDMSDTHQGMNISAADYMHAVDDIMEVLEKHSIDDASKKDVLAILWSLKEAIMSK
ncbi:group I truncated hemoglobin [Cyclobacterium plantarum]|uniref:Group 1 truncated hemoglobin n=1 Tax=Cyclobacterium plantarum TaxID=2716263 RepID=A0ABX0H7W1_9BACT|nr:group 1 truncated hemoglobin [Cyclobacterium plantarum]NHE56478.1 group 1 truncated hemoglobin [Cyclobacterium plantarum]